MVIFEFDAQASKYTGEIYGYYPYSKLSQFRWTEDERQVVKILLNKIDTQALCQQCNATNCQILYLSKEAAPWERSARILQEYKDKGELLCSACALDRLLPVLRNNPKHFAEGLYLPYQEAGIYITTEL